MMLDPKIHLALGKFATLALLPWECPSFFFFLKLSQPGYDIIVAWIWEHCEYIPGSLECNTLESVCNFVFHINFILL